MSALLRGVTSNHNGDFYCLNCFHSYSTEKKPQKHEKVCNDHDYCYVEMPDEGYRILKYNNGEKSLKAPTIIHTDLKCLLDKMSTCHNNPDKSSTEKKTMHEAAGYSVFTRCSFDSTKNKIDCYWGKDCLKTFCNDLEEHVMKVINYEKKKWYH